MKKDFRYDAALLSRASFPAGLEADDRPCIVEITVYRLNAVAVTSLMLDGFDPLLNFIGLSPDDTYITQHEVEDIVTVVHIRKEAETWQQEPDPAAQSAGKLATGNRREPVLMPGA